MRVKGSWPFRSNAKSVSYDLTSVAHDSPSRGGGPYDTALDALQVLLTDPEIPMPVVFCVAGPFGTGKTTFLRLIEHGLRRNLSPEERHLWLPVFVSVRDEHVETREQAWAVLVSAMYSQFQQSMPSGIARLAFRTRLEMARRGSRSFFRRVVLPTVFGLVVAVAGVIASVGPSDVVLIGRVTAIAGAIVATSTALRAHAKAFREPVAWLKEQTIPDRVSGALPIFRTVRKELEDLLYALGPGHRVVVLIDGLDQPDPGQLREVVEAVRAIRQSAELKLAIILSMDADLVVASIEAAFNDAWNSALRSRSHQLADVRPEDQLAAVVDLSVILPGPDSSLVKNWFESEIPAPVRNGVLDTRFSENEALLEPISMHLVRYLPQPSSPRWVKQFLQAFRFQALLAAEATELDAEQLDTLGRFVMLRRRWPALAAEMDREPQLIRALDRAARSPHGSIAPPIEIAEDVRHWLAITELRALLADAKVGVSELPLERFVHIT